jgi:hypothetical protein
VIEVDLRCSVAGVGSAMGRPSAGAEADIKVEFTDADGTLWREPLSGCQNVAFERVAAVRGFARRGFRHPLAAGKISRLTELAGGFILDRRHPALAGGPR